MVDLPGAGIRLRSLVLDDLDSLIAGGEGQPSFLRESRAQTRARLRERIERNPTLEDGGLLNLGIEVAGDLVGEIQARAPKCCFPPGVCEIGITLFSAARGHGWGGEAVQLFTNYLRREGWGRVQASTACENVAMRRVLDRAGYQYEGVLRAFSPGDDGGRVDYVMYAATQA